MTGTGEKKSVDFLRGIPSEEALSHLIPMASTGFEKVISRYGTGVLQYGHFNGFKPLRDLLGKIHDVNPERIIVGNGGMEVISLFFKSLPRGSNIVVEEATYDRAIFDAERYGHNVIGIELTADGVDLDQLIKIAGETPVAAFYGIPFHQNPTGICYSQENRDAVEQICKKKGILCAWDVCYEQLRYDGKRNTSILVSEWGPILMSSFTKTISPGTKCGYIIIPGSHLEIMTKIVANTRLNPNLPTQAFIADFMESGKFDDYLNYLRDLYRPRMDALNSSLASAFSEVPCFDVSGGFFTSLSLEWITTDKEQSFIQSAKEAGIGISAAWDAVAPNFRESKRKQGMFIRLPYPASEPENIKWGISRLRELVDTFC